LFPSWTYRRFGFAGILSRRPFVHLVLRRRTIASSQQSNIANKNRGSRIPLLASVLHFT
jgi:hypothetical protein